MTPGNSVALPYENVPRQILFERVNAGINIAVPAPMRPLMIAARLFARSSFVFGAAGWLAAFGLGSYWDGPSVGLAIEVTAALLSFGVALSGVVLFVVRGASDVHPTRIWLEADRLAIVDVRTGKVRTWPRDRVQSADVRRFRWSRLRQFRIHLIDRNPIDVGYTSGDEFAAVAEAFNAAVELQKETCRR